MSKNALINSYISRADEIIEAKNQTNAKNFVVEAITVFKDEIPNIDKRLDYINFYKNDSQSDFINDAQMVKAHLVNYRANLKAGYIPFKGDDHSISVQTSVSTKVETNIIVQCEMALENINKLSDNIINDEEKSELEEKIASLQLEISKKKKDKSKISEKLMNILKFVITKGPEVYIAISNFLSFISKEIMPLFQ